jgi:uncharacterized protein YjeT (DUF2065 family)
LNLIRLTPAKGQDMQTSLFLARLIGPVFLVIGVSIAADRTGFQAIAKEFLKSRALIYIAGLLALVPGLAIVLTHNVWVADWRVLITLLGWLSIIGGLFRVMFPQKVMTLGKAATKNPNTMLFSAGFMLVLGAILTFYGYFA